MAGPVTSPRFLHLLAQHASPSSNLRLTTPSFPSVQNGVRVLDSRTIHLSQDQGAGGLLLLFPGNWHRCKALSGPGPLGEGPTLYLECHFPKAQPAHRGHACSGNLWSTQHGPPSYNVLAWSSAASLSLSLPQGPQTLGDINKMGRKCCVAMQASLGVPKIEICFIRHG